MSWEGPSWLKFAEKDWPTQDLPELSDEFVTSYRAEIRPNVIYEVALVTIPDPTSPFGIDDTKFSSLNRTIRVTELCQKFVHKLQKRHTSDVLIDADDFQRAKDMWVRYSQEMYLSRRTKLTALKDSQLSLWKDECGFWRCRGRMTNASDLSFDAKQPRVLPVKAHFTRLVVKSVHEGSHHSGVSQTLATVRNEFWIPRGRTVVGSVLAKCLVCRKYQGGPFTLPEMPDLPSVRISPNAAFTYVGLYYLGPLYVKTGNANGKVCICLFTCLTVRAIHLELVRGLNSEQFMLCLRRFIAKRGKSVMIISNDAPQFKLTQSAVQSVWSKCINNDDVVSFSAKKGIIWKFIVEFAPWSGGFYERLVGVVKRALRKALGKLCLHFDQLASLVTEIEPTVNCRPLTFVGKDYMPDQILTPSNFLTVNPKIGAPHMSTEELSDPDYVVGLTRRCNIIESWRRGVAHLDRFWSIWSKDYLLSLRESMALKHKEPRIHSDRFPLVGQVVLVKEPLLSRSSWRLGRIEAIISGCHDKVRSVCVRLHNRKTINRPVNLLYPLECEEYRDEEDFRITPVSTSTQPTTPISPLRKRRSVRKAAQVATQKIAGIDQLASLADG